MRTFYDFYRHTDTWTLTLIASMSCIFAAAIGGVVDRVLQDRGFGVIGNALLIVIGVLLGMLLSFENQIPLRLSPNARVLIYATFAPTFLLVFCAMLKAWLQQSR